MKGLVQWVSLGLAAGGLVNGIQVDFTDADSIKSASSTIAYDLLSFYSGNETGQIPGELPMPYYWWETGAMFMHMVDYYYYTGDTTYNPTTIQAMTWQAGTDGSFMPPNQTKDEGNDDQVFWAFAAMSAAELKFPPPTKGYPSWAAMAQAVFNLQAERWDPQDCGGGLRWQINPLNNGYDYKNIPTNGGFFQLASRLARYTNNGTYVNWAEKMWDWMSTSTLIETSGDSIFVYDGASVEGDCQKPNKAQYSYNYGILIAGMAYIYNHTEDEKWMTPLTGLVNGVLATFFRNEKILVEEGCEPYNDCNTDGLTFKSFTIRWLVLATQLVPSLYERVWPYVEASAKGAAGQCDGGDSDTVCGYHWTTTTWDGSTGVGQQMSALSVIQAGLIPLEGLFAPLTLQTGATSKQNPNAGEGISTNPLKPITTGDKAGAGILTALVLAAMLGGTYWLVAVEVG